MDLRSVKREAKGRDHYVLELYERRCVSYKKLAIELGISAGQVGFRVRRGRAARRWDKRECARKRDLGLTDRTVERRR